MPILFFAVVLISFKLPSFLKPEDCVQKARSPAEVSRCSRAFAKLPAKYEGLSLHDAIQNKDMQALQALIQSGADVNAKNEKELTPLHYAAEYQPQAVKPLIDAGADVNAKDSLELPPLHYAAKHQPQAIKPLIKAGADVNAESELTHSTSLHFAAQHQPESVSILIKAGADVNAKDGLGNTPLHYAAKHQPQAVKPLIEAGADVNAGSELTHSTPLHFAIKHQPQAVKPLIEAGADVNAENESGNAPLYTAIKHQPQAVKPLIEAGAHFNAEAQKAFQIAIIQGNTEFIKILIEAGIDIHAEVGGWTPIKIALLSNQKQIVKMLQELGAKINFDRYSEFSRIIPASFYKERSLGIEWEGAVKTNTKRSDAIRNLKAELAERIIKREFSESNHSFILRIQGNPPQSLKNRQQLLEEIKKHIQFGEIGAFKITDTLTKKTQNFRVDSSELIVNSNGKNPETWDFSLDGSIKIKSNYKNWTQIELVSPVLKSPKDVQFFLSFLDDMIKKDLLSAQPVKEHSAGLHIHTGTQNLTKKEKRLFIEAYLLVEKHLFHYFKPHRGRAHYAKPLTLKGIIMSNQKDPLRKLNDKYRSVYFNEDYKTLEFRLFNSTSDADKIQFQAQFVRALLKGITHNKPQIVEWIQKEWQKRSKNQNLNRDSLDEMFQILNLNPEFS